MARPTRRPAPVTSATRPVRRSLASGGRGTTERLDPLVLSAQPFARHVHHPDGARPVGRAVPVGATARDESELVDRRAHPRDVLRGVRWMLDLDAVEAERGQRLDTLARAARARMR